MCTASTTTTDWHRKNNDAKKYNQYGIILPQRKSEKPRFCKELSFYNTEMPTRKRGVRKALPLPPKSIARGSQDGNA
jgi:hypothetical protein